jgi:hypothetical protein
MTTKITPPTGIGHAGGTLWIAIVGQAAEDGLALDARELRWLRDAAAEADQLARIEAALAGAELEVIGSTGQPRAHPMLAEASRSRSIIAALLGRLGLVDPADARPGSGSRTTSASARRAALIRHHGGRGLGA